MSKVLERHFHFLISEHLSIHYPLANCQWGFSQRNKQGQENNWDALQAPLPICRQQHVALIVHFTSSTTRWICCTCVGSIYSAGHSAPRECAKTCTQGQL